MGSLRTALSPSLESETVTAGQARHRASSCEALGVAFAPPEGPNRGQYPSVSGGIKRPPETAISLRNAGWGLTVSDSIENEARPDPGNCPQETLFPDQVHRQTGARMRGSAIKTETEEISSAELGWRFGLGTALMGGGYIAWTLIPVVIATDLEPTVKAVIAGLFGATPFLTKVVAIAIMGRPAYRFLKKTIHDYIRRRAGRSQKSERI